MTTQKTTTDQRLGFDALNKEIASRLEAYTIAVSEYKRSRNPNSAFFDGGASNEEVLNTKDDLVRYLRKRAGKRGSRIVK